MESWEDFEEEEEVIAVAQGAYLNRHKYAH